MRHSRHRQETHQTNIDININHLSQDRNISNHDLSDLNHFGKGKIRAAVKESMLIHKIVSDIVQTLYRHLL